MAAAVTQYDFTVTRGSTFQGLLIRCKYENGGALNITGYTPFAEIRKKAGSLTLTKNLNPAISNAAQGLVSIPAIQDEDTLSLPKGEYAWDFILQTPTGERTEPLIRGDVIIQDKVTQPPES